MNDQEIIKAIQLKFPGVYPDQRFSVLMPEINKMLPVVRLAFENFLLTGENQEINLLGYSVKQLRQTQGMNELAAYLTLSWLIREPVLADSSLKRGHDRIT